MSRPSTLSTLALLLVAACGARWATDPLDEEESDAAPTNRPDVPDTSCLDAPTSSVVLVDADALVPAELYDIVPRVDGSLFVVGAGKGFARCPESDVQGEGGHFIALLTAELRVVWERRMSSANWGRELQIASAPDGGLFVLAGSASTLIADADDGMALGHFDATGELRAVSIALQVNNDQSLCVSPTGVIVTGRCDRDAQGICSGSEWFTNALVWLDHDLRVQRTAVLGGRTGGADKLTCAFDGEEAILGGRGSGRVEIGGDEIDLGESARFVARLSSSGALLDHRFSTDWPSIELMVVDGVTGDIVFSGEAEETRIVRLHPDLFERWAVVSEGGHPHHVSGLAPDAHGGAVIAFRHGGTSVAGHDLVPGHAVLAVDADGAVRWAVGETATVRVAVETAHGLRLIGGQYDAFTMPTHGGPWPAPAPMSNGNGFLMVLPGD